MGEPTSRPGCPALDGAALRQWAHAAVGDLITHVDEINRLNVFPVADSDTGTNMLFTMRAALARVDSDGDGAGDAAAVTRALSAGALHGARGNSGVILSQILRGFAEVTAEAVAHRRLSALDAEVFGAGLRRGVATVVAAMGNTRQSCQDAAENTSKVNASLDLMAGEVVEINDLISHIATAAEEQSAVAEEINRNMSAIAEVIRQLTSNGEETVASSASMQKTYDRLREIVGHFRLA